MIPKNRFGNLIPKALCALLFQSTIWVSGSYAADLPSAKSEIEALKAIFQTLPHCTLSGTLRYQVPLARTRLLDQLGLAVVLKHNVETDYQGRPVSTWIFSGLQTYLTPDGRDSLRWRPMGGDDGKFGKKNIGSTFPESWDGPCVIRKANDTAYEIKTRNGLLWTYTNGVLSKIVIPGFGELQVTCCGAFVESITLVGQPEAELNVEYLQTGRPSSIQTREGSKTVLHWEGNILVGWESPYSSIMGLSYHERLLEKITHKPSGEEMAITWRQNPSWGRGDSKWPAPVQISSFGDERYSLEVEEVGLVIHSTLADGKKGTVVVNPLSGLVEVKSAYGAFRFRNK